jgi:hypothetical protein
MSYNPINIQKYHIYDIFYSDMGNLVIVSPSDIKPYTIKLIDNNKTITLSLERCPHNHTYIYHCKLEKYTSKITLLINDDNIETMVNRYPTFENEIIMSTLVKNEDSIILQWIKYHMLLGVSRFIIYDNSKSPDTRYHSVETSSNLPLILKSYIDKGIVVLIEWHYPKYLEKTGVSGQTTQQNHSIYAFQKSKYIGLFDVDEYVNPQSSITNLDELFTKIINDNKLNINNISAFTLLNKFFYNPNNNSTTGYDFLKIYNCNNISRHGHEKNFVIPKNVKTFSVHMVTKGKRSHRVNHEIIYFNHYHFLNKLDRGRNKTKLIDNSIKRIADLL